MKLLTALSIAALFGTADAWYGTGHLLVARIANDILAKKSPATL